MDVFIHVVRGLDSTPLSLVWIVLLIDCFMNTHLKGPQKLWWVLFILLTQFFGALLYFFLGPAQIYRRIVSKMNQPYQPLDQRRTQQPSSSQWYQAPSAAGPQSTRQDSAAYQEGYRAQSPAPPEAGPSDALYEEPQAMYPEMTQEQK